MKKCPQCGKRRLWFVEHLDAWVCYNCGYQVEAALRVSNAVSKLSRERENETYRYQEMGS